MQPTRTVLSAILIAAIVLGCGRDPVTTEVACANNERRCYGNVAEICISGAWTVNDNCLESGRICDADSGTCVLPPVDGASSADVDGMAGTDADQEKDGFESPGDAVEEDGAGRGSDLGSNLPDASDGGSSPDAVEAADGEVGSDAGADGDDAAGIEPPECDGCKFGAVCVAGDCVCQGGDEICNGNDDDCDGLTDEGCDNDDWDGDGQVGVLDCNPYDPAFHAGSLYPKCCTSAKLGTLSEVQALAVCDFDCDGQPNACQAEDSDGDGALDSVDCAPVDPAIHPGAPEKCDDGIDQDCVGGDLSCAGIVDDDSDGYAAPADCNDDNGAVHPSAAELCNAKDDDCNGFVDDGVDGVGEACPNPGTPDGVCGTAELMGALACVYTVEGEVTAALLGCVGYYIAPLEETACDGLDEDCDGQVDEDFGLGTSCTAGTGTCQNVGSVVCDGDGVGVTCSVSGEPEGTACDDDDPCTQDDQCDGGDASSCSGVTYACDDDGLGCTSSVCLGDGTCAVTPVEGTCLIDGACVAGGDPKPSSECLVCDPTASTGGWTPAADGLPCAGDKCALTATCTGGTCQAVDPFVCDDGDPCTVDSCDPSLAGDGCEFAATSGPVCEDDGVACTDDQCVAGACTHTPTPGACLIGGACFAGSELNPTNTCEVCAPTNPMGWTAQPDDVPCDDGNKCSATSVCADGSCVFATPELCDDTNECTQDSCDPSAPGDGCGHTPLDGVGCEDDGLSCTFDT